jgi:hypothetical protein
MDGSFNTSAGLELPEPDLILPNGAEAWRSLEQGSREWLMLRAGLPTASELSSLLVKGKGPNGLGAGALTYAHTVAAELLLGGPVSTFQGNEHTERGHALEGELADNYALLRGVDLDTLGFIRRSRFGYSPDRLVGANGLLEVKAPQAHKVIGMLRDADFPTEYRAQALGGLYATDREWIDLVAGARDLPECIRRLDHDRVKAEVETLRDALDRFVAYVDDTVAFVRNLAGDGPEAAAMAQGLAVAAK